MNKCVKCGIPIEKNSDKGRSKTYCSVGCRRAAELEIRRINGRIEGLEKIAESYRLKVPMLDAYGKEEDVLKEIALQEAKLKALLGGMEKD